MRPAEFSAATHAPGRWESSYIPEGSVVHRAVAQHGHFVRFAAKGVTFTDCDFSYARFDDTYFFEATFIRCTFVGAVFTSCVFRSATFRDCTFDYARFTATILPVRGILSQLPSEPNWSRNLCRELRKNFESLGDGRAARLCLVAEFDAEADHFKRAFRARDGYYRRKYGGRPDEQFFKGVEYVGNRISRWLWGHGESPGLVLAWSGVALVALSAVAWFADYADGFGNSVYLTGMTFLTLSPIGLADPTSPPRTFLLATGFVGYAALGLFVTSLFRRLARR